MFSKNPGLPHAISYFQPKRFARSLERSRHFFLAPPRTTPGGGSGGVLGAFRGRSGGKYAYCYFQTIREVMCEDD